MLKRLLPFLFAVFFFSEAGAQAKTKAKAKALFKSAMQFKALQKMPEVFTALTQSISVYNKFDSAHYELGTLYLGSGKTPEAVASFHKALSISPKMTVALVALGKVYRDYTQNLDSALKYYQLAAATDNKNKEIFYSIAWTYNAKGEFDSAIEYGKKALEVDNDYKPAYSEMAHAYRRVGKYAEAIEQFKKNLAISTVDLALLYSGYCYTELKNKEGAMEMYESLNKVNEKMATSLKRVIDKMN